ncbi:MAG: Indolepyruvate oxidoreductase subunit IorB [Methanothrix sp.]|jgi:indolepyruvate ferredoxin oxidoreductase beta subunit|nr:MAG: Indolepyruvate oxidoreductase subunit IorB [Methanothrix sp.]
MRTSDCDVVVVGVGGQGVILISEIIGRAAMLAGLSVRGVETHGMAQRGGSVINHIRVGCSYSAMISPGGGDVLVAMEPAEALRYASYLSPAGVALVNTRPLLPVTVTTGQASYPSIEEILAPLREASSRVYPMDATGLAGKAGSPQAANVVMLGALARHLPIGEGRLQEALSEIVPARFLEVNRKAFELGKIEVE